MASQTALQQLLGNARLGTYLSAAAGDVERATDLYLWATQLSGALHGQISFVEVAVRNAVDVRLASWNQSQGQGRDWSAESRTAAPVYSLLRKALKEARSRAARESAARASGHPRSGAAVTHDDVVAQLMFGSWVALVRPMSATESPVRQELLWREALAGAFPGATAGDAGRVETGRQLEVLRRLRNRVAHHDNILGVDVPHRFNGMLSLLSKMDPAYPAVATARSTIRRLLREDPRCSW
jgi:hypothetical protein